MAGAKRVTVYVWRDEDDREVFSVFRPGFKNGSLVVVEVDTDGDSEAYYLTGRFRRGLGLDAPVPAGRVVRLTLAVEAVDAADVVPTFKPIARK